MAAEGMPPGLLDLFAPRPPLDPMPATRRRRQIRPSGLVPYVENFAEEVPVPLPPFETPKQRHARLKREKLEAHREHLKALIKDFDPHSDPNTTRDPYASLFVGRVSYETTEKKLKREFEVYGHIRKLRLVCDNEGKPRGYAFIEFESERDMKEAYKHGDGKKIDGRRVLVDVERGRTVQGWLPRRLGGGKGPARFALAKPKPGLPPPQLNGPNLSVGRPSQPPFFGGGRGGGPPHGGGRFGDGRPPLRGPPGGPRPGAPPHHRPGPYRANGPRGGGGGDFHHRGGDPRYDQRPDYRGDRPDHHNDRPPHRGDHRPDARSDRFENRADRSNHRSDYRGADYRADYRDRRR